MESNSTAILIKIKLRHSLGRRSRSDFVQCQVIFVSILYMTSLLLSYFVHNAQNQSANISAFHDCTFTMKRRSTCDKFIALKLLEKLYNIAILFSLVCHKQKRKSPVKSLPLL